jgi:hypothetical protein
MHVHFWDKPSIDVVRFWLDVMDVDVRELLHTLRGLATAARKSDDFEPTTSPFVWLWDLLQLRPSMEKYKSLVYHNLYRALPVGNKFIMAFSNTLLAYSTTSSIQSPTKADAPFCSSAFNGAVSVSFASY